MTLEEKIKLLHSEIERVVKERARLAAENARLREAIMQLIAYRDAAGALNFQLEKADDFINKLRALVEK